MSEMSIISGRPSFSAKFMRSRVRQAGHRLRESFDPTTGTATAIIIRSDDPEFEHKAEWNQKKAENHQLWNKGHWKKNPELMLKNRALSEVVREACYEVMGGVAYTPDEIQDFTPINAPSERVQPQTRPTQTSAAGHIKDTLGGEPVQADIPDGLLDEVAQAESEADLAKIYEQHKAQPYWEKLKPALSTRKAEIQHDQQMADEAASQPELTGEVVEGEVA